MKYYDSLLRRFYGLENGLANEHKQQRLNQWGNLAFMLMTGHLFISTLVALTLSIVVGTRC